MLSNPEYLIYIDYILLLLLAFTSCQQLFSSKFNLYGVVSIVSIAIYFSIHSINSAFNIFVLVAFFAAIILIVLELFVPGGILGILGIAALLYAITSINQTNQYISFVIIITLIIFIIQALLNIYVFKKKMLFLNKLVLEDSLSTEKGYIANKSDNSLVGKEFLAYTDLRPAGIATCNDDKYDVVSEGDFIEKGSQLIVTEVVGMRIVVRKK